MGEADGIQPRSGAGHLPALRAAQRAGAAPEPPAQQERTKPPRSRSGIGLPVPRLSLPRGPGHSCGSGCLSARGKAMNSLVPITPERPGQRGRGPCPPHGGPCREGAGAASGLCRALLRSRWHRESLALKAEALGERCQADKMQLRVPSDGRCSLAAVLPPPWGLCGDIGLAGGQGGLLGCQGWAPGVPGVGSGLTGCRGGCRLECGCVRCEVAAAALMKH